jgi:hypothetical protein
MMNRICKKCGKEFMCRGQYFGTCKFLNEKINSCRCQECNLANKDSICENIIKEQVQFT